MNYRIGLDIGITSVGWAVIENDEKGHPIRIVDLGCRIFEAAENPKTGDSLAKVRKNARSIRRNNRRKVHRIKRVKQLLQKYNILTENEIENLYSNKKLTDIYILRVKGLDSKLENKELARVLINLVKKRGYNPYSKTVTIEENKSNGKVLTAISENKRIMLKNGYRSVAEMYLKDDKFKLKYQNGKTIYNDSGNIVVKCRNSVNEYTTTVEREMLLSEAKLILKTQKKYNNKINNKFIEEYINIFSSQRNFDEGPGFPSKYGGNLIENMIGKCTFEKEEKRAPKATYTFEKFKLLQDFNTIKLTKLNLLESKNHNMYNKSDNLRSLTEKEKIILLDKFQTKTELKYSQIRKLLKIPYNYIFNTIEYDFRKITKENINYIIDEEEEKINNKIVEFQSFHKMRKALDKLEKGYIYKFRESDLDNIAVILTMYKSDEKRSELLKECGINKKAIEKLLPLSFSKVSHLSLKAMKKLIPYLKEGYTYETAVNMVYYDNIKSDNKNKKEKLSLKDIGEIANPVVRRGISQTIKVINAITQKYGKPDFINIEIAKELNKSFAQRKNLQKAMQENMEINIEAVKELKKYNIKENITGQDIIKYKLWKEQKGICPYSGKKIYIKNIFSKDIVIDHIIPYSKCFDDSYNNKVLVKSSEIKQKLNKTPIEYLNNSKRNIEEYILRIENMYMDNKRKKENLLKEKVTKEDEKVWKTRNLKDTQYITKEILNLIRNYLEFSDNKHVLDDRRVVAVKGAITNLVRKRLNIEKIREGDKHHAMDAAVIAITTDSMIEEITNYEKSKEKSKDEFPVPYKNFELELKARLKDTDVEVEKGLKNLKIKEYKESGYPKSVFISRMPKRKVSGCAHKETIFSKSKNKGCIVTKKELTSLKLDENGEIQDYYNKDDDLILYNALKERLIKYNNNALEAFKEPFYKPKSNGELGPLVKKVKIEARSTSNVYLKKMNGVACNGSVVRIDVFCVKNEGYYFIPIYVSDTIKEDLPNKACVTLKRNSEWEEMDDKNFIFSVYPNDLLYIKSKNEIRFVPMNEDSQKEDLFTKEFYGYYIKCNISSASISVSSHDRVYYKPSLGIRNLEELKKYYVDVLGNLHEVKIPEKRIKFNLKYKSKKS